MRLEDLLKEVPELENYIQYMPEELYKRHTIRVYPPGTIIHQKDYPLASFGIIEKGEHRVINEFENGNVYMIEKNEPIDFVGEVTILEAWKKLPLPSKHLQKQRSFIFPEKTLKNG